MTKLTVDAKVTAPPAINIPLVRADHLGTCNIFRVFFEVFLSLFSAILGYVISTDSNKIQIFHWVCLAITGLSAISFLIVNLCYVHKAKQSQKQPQ